jgi:Flp pilus assembly protein TadB
MIRALLTIAGPALTACGAGLLAYDVLRGPSRQRRARRHERRLDAAEERRETTALSLAESSEQRSTRAQKAGLAKIETRHAQSVQRAENTNANAEEREQARTFQLAVLGFCLVMAGGLAETVAAVLVLW